MTKKESDGPVLVPVDFSPQSEAALLYALRIADCLKVSILVLHVVHDPGEMPGYYSKALKKKQLIRIEDGAATMLDEFLENFVKQHPDAERIKQADSKLVTGLPPNRILEVAEQKKASMIVLGSRGLTGLKRMVIGSVAERVVHFSTVPVTVIK